MIKPTQQELDTAIEVMDYVLEHTIEHEPYAIAYISNLESALSEFPSDVDELEGKV